MVEKLFNNILYLSFRKSMPRASCLWVVLGCFLFLACFFFRFYGLVR